MTYAIVIPRYVAKEIADLPKPLRGRVESAIQGLGDDPRPSGCKKLVGGLQRYRVRVAALRILYDVFDDHLVVQVVTIGHRRDIYR